MTTTHYYRAYDLNDPNMFFFSITVWEMLPEQHARVRQVAIIDPDNGNLDIYDEDEFSRLVAMTFTDKVEEISREQFDQVRIDYIKEAAQ